MKIFEDLKLWVSKAWASNRGSGGERLTTDSSFNFDKSELELHNLNSQIVGSRGPFPALSTPPIGEILEYEIVPGSVTWGQTEMSEARMVKFGGGKSIKAVVSYQAQYRGWNNLPQGYHLDQFKICGYQLHDTYQDFNSFTFQARAD